MEGQRIFSTGSDIVGDGFRGTVSEYAVEGNAFRLCSRQPSLGNAPCHLCFDGESGTLYCANYANGSVTVFPVGEKLESAAQCITHTGCGPHPTRQAAPHVHQVTRIPGSRFLAACDLGTDDAVVYAIGADGLLTEYSRTHLHGGPRHIAYRDDSTAYLVHELSNEITVLSVRNGVFDVRQTLSTLPEKFTGENLAAAVYIRENRVYVSNRGHGSIAVYRIGPDSLLTLERYIPAGIFPRDFFLLEDGRILVADQRAGIRLLAADGQERAFLPQLGVIRICPLEAGSMRETPRNAGKVTNYFNGQFPEKQAKEKRRLLL